MEQISEQQSSPIITFEEALDRLEAVVAELEKGDLSLEKALEAFQEGIKNLSICIKDLDLFEQQIEVLLAEYYASAPDWLGGTDRGGKTK